MPMANKDTTKTDTQDPPKGADKTGAADKAGIRTDDLPNKEQLGAQALPPITDVKATDRGEYRPQKGVHLAEAGEVALDNWTGKVDGRRVTVQRGTQVKALPANVRKALDASGVRFGQITYEELGLRQPGYGPGARVVGVNEG
jgi:hypothetical protein